MNYTEQYIKVLNTINKSEKPLSTKKDFSESETRLIIELKKEEYILGEWSYNSPPIINIRPTVKGRIFQDDLQQKQKERTFKGRLSKHTPIVIAVILGFLSNILIEFIKTKYF